MSRAFVKEEGEGRWTPPPTPAEFRVLAPAPGGPEVLREADDLLELLRWVAARPVGGLEVRARDGRLLAVSSAE